MLRSLRTFVADVLRPMPLGNRVPLEPPHVPDHAIIWEYRKKAGVWGEMVCYAPPLAPCRQNEAQECVVVEHMKAESESIFEGCEQDQILARTAVTPLWRDGYFDWAFA